MSRVVLTKDLVANLGTFDQPVELVDEQGQVLGYAIDPSTYRLSQDRANPFWPFTQEELIQSEKQDRSKGITTEQLKERLRKL